jgi:hypothetical protein
MTVARAPSLREWFGTEETWTRAAKNRVTPARRKGRQETVARTFSCEGYEWPQPARTFNLVNVDMGVRAASNSLTLSSHLRNQQQSRDHMGFCSPFSRYVVLLLMHTSVNSPDILPHVFSKVDLFVKGALQSSQCLL